MSRRKVAKGARARDGNLVRIIGGTHRGRRLEFPTVDGLRPTPDRVRETLFNWLQPVISGTVCLDLFAGSGALGLEAASRGAARVVLIDRSPEAVEHIQRGIGLLGLNNAEVHQADALDWLDHPGPRFDVVFLDPPFSENLLTESLRRLDIGDWLTRDARVYMEVDRRSSLPPLPSDWEVLKQKKAGQVCYYLCRCKLQAGGEAVLNNTAGAPN